MKRHAGLVVLSEHHHHALLAALAIRKAAAGPPEQRSSSLVRAGRAFLDLWDRAGTRHFREEEETLLPAWAARLPIRETECLIHMLTDHAEIRALIGRIRTAFREGRTCD